MLKILCALGFFAVLFLIVEIHHSCKMQQLKKERRQRAYEILKRKEAAKAALRKSKEDEAWASYVFDETEEFRHDFGDDRAAG